MGTRKQARLVHRHVHRPLLALHDERVSKVYAVDLRADAGDGVREKSGRGGVTDQEHASPTRHAAPRGIRERERAPPPPMRGVGAPSPAAGARSTAPTRRCPWGSVLDSGCADQRTEFSILGYMNIS